MASMQFLQFLQGTVISLVTAAVTYGIWRAVYNLYLHPLRHFPGPRAAAVSDFFKLWVLNTKNGHNLALQAHQRWGPVVRVAPNLLSVNDPYLLQQIYHRRANKTDVYTTGFLGDIAPPFQTLDWREHALKRKRVASSFSVSNLTKLEGQVDERVTEWTRSVSTRFADTGLKMDFAAWSQWFAYDTVSQFAFGQPLGFVKEARDISNLIKNFHDVAPFAAVVGALPWLCGPLIKNPITKYFLLPRPGDNSGMGKIMAFRDALLKLRFEEPQTGHSRDFLDNILAATNADGSPITLDEVKVECLVLMVAGSDTTAALFCSFVRYVTETPGVLDRLLEEIDDGGRRGLLEQPIPKYSSICKLRYFGACHREALRLHPPTPIILPRYVSEGGLDLYGKVVPAGTEIGANPYVINRDKGIFGDDADYFRPERWLENPEKEALMDKYLMSWGYGARICLGKHVALLETYKLLVQFFRLYRPSLVNPNKPWREENLALMVHFDMWIHLKHRAPANVSK